MIKRLGKPVGRYANTDNNVSTDESVSTLNATEEKDLNVNSNKKDKYIDEEIFEESENEVVAEHKKTNRIRRKSLTTSEVKAADEQDEDDIVADDYFDDEQSEEVTPVKEKKRISSLSDLLDDDSEDSEEEDSYEENDPYDYPEDESEEDIDSDLADDSESDEEQEEAPESESEESEEAEEDEEDEDEEIISKAKKKKTEFRLNRAEFSEADVEYISGFPVAPIKLDSYDSAVVTENEAKIIQKLGINSITIIEGDPFPAKVFCTQNAIAMLDKGEDRSCLKWIGDFVQLENKSKGTNGKVYVDVIVTDELSSKRITQPVSVLTDRSKVKSLSNFDIHISSFDSITVAIAIKKVLEKMPINDKNKELGVVAFPGSDIGFKFNGYDYADGFEIKNNCVDYEDYINEFNELIEPSVPLQFLIAATMGATILTILQEAFNYDLHSYCINVVGSSSTGKTISSQVAASIWTNPTSDKIFSAMLSTTNAALKRLSGRNGIPTFVDEASAVIGNIKAEEYAYQVYEQCEKHRLNSDCSEKESGKWSTVVVMTSEQRFAASTKNQNGGLAVRIHVIDNQMWTTDKDHAERLVKFVRSNYGVLGKEFTKILFTDLLLFEELPERYEEAREVINKVCAKHKNDFTDRLCNIYAVTLVTAMILQENLGLNLDIKGIAQILANHNKYVAKEQNLALNAYRAIISYITRNPGRPGIRKDIVGKKVERYIIEESLMNDILSKAGFQDSTVTIKALDDAGFLIRQGVNQKGLKSKLTVDGTLCRCYQIDATLME